MKDDHSPIQYFQYVLVAVCRLDMHIYRALKIVHFKTIVDCVLLEYIYIAFYLGQVFQYHLAPHQCTPYDISVGWRTVAVMKVK